MVLLKFMREILITKVETIVLWQYYTMGCPQILCCSLGVAVLFITGGRTEDARS